MLNGLLGSTVHFGDGSTLTADAAYVRESILNPTAKVVTGFQPIMPTFQGQVTEEQILALTEYIKSLPAAAPDRQNWRRRREPGHANACPTKLGTRAMTTTDAARAAFPARHYLNEPEGVKSWLLTTDHKRIALLYLFSITAFFFLGGFFALLIRLQLLIADRRRSWARTPTTRCSPCTA